MECFFDKYGRDRIIHDWCKKKDVMYVRLYEWMLAKRPQYKDFNDLILLAFEAGIAFSRATERQARQEVGDGQEA